MQAKACYSLIITCFISHSPVASRDNIATVLNAYIFHQPVVVLSQLEKLIEIESTVAVRIVHAKNRLGKSLREIRALSGIIFDETLQFSPLQISVVVRVVLKYELHGNRMIHELGHKRRVSLTLSKIRRTR